MRLIFLLLITAVSTAGFSATYGVSPSKNLEMGGRTLEKAELTSANIIYLISSDTGTANYGTFRLWNGTAGYTVPGGQTLRIIGIKCNTHSTSGQHSIKLLYGDTDVGFTSAAAPTNPVYMGGSSAANYGVCSLQAGVTAQSEDFSNFTIPTGKLPAFLGRGGPLTVTLVGILE